MTAAVLQAGEGARGHVYSLFPNFSGTGSYPPFEKGLQRRMRQMVSAG